MRPLSTVVGVLKACHKNFEALEWTAARDGLRVRRQVQPQLPFESVVQRRHAARADPRKSFKEPVMFWSEGKLTLLPRALFESCIRTLRRNARCKLARARLATLFPSKRT